MTDKGLEAQSPQITQLDFSRIDEEDCVIIPAYPNEKHKKKSFNRAKEKRDFQKRVDEELYRHKEDDLEL